MKFPRNAPEFLGFRIDDQFRSWLPSGKALQSGSVLVQQAARGSLMLSQWQNYADLQRFVGGRIAVQFGVPGEYQSAIRGLFDSIPAVLDEQWARSWQSGVLDVGVDIVQRFVREVFVEVPFVGWVVKIGLAVADWGIALAQMFHQDAERLPAPEAAAVYEKEVDEGFARVLLGHVSNADWTELFMAQAADRVMVSDITAGDLYQRDGGKFAVTNASCKFGEGECPQTGILPGIADIFSTWQYGYASAPRKGLRPGSLASDGRLLPASVQVGTMLWQTAMKNGPNRFRVDLDQIGASWDNFFSWLVMAANQPDEDALRLFVRPGKVSRWEDLHDALVLACGGVNEYRPFPNAVTWSPSPQLPDVPWQDPLRPNWGDAVRANLEGLRARLEPSLETLTCAYVDKSFAGFRGQPKLVEKLEDMRRLLLNHKARFLVDLTQVPDASYRNALWQARRTLDDAIAADTSEDGPPTIDAFQAIATKLQVSSLEGSPLVLELHTPLPRNTHGLDLVSPWAGVGSSSESDGPGMLAVVGGLLGVGGLAWGASKLLRRRR